MTVTVIVIAKARLESRDDLKKWIVEHLEEARLFDGCQSLNLYTTADSPNEVVLIEEWDSREHHERFGRWSNDRGNLAEIAVMLEGEPSVRYCDRVDA